MPAPHEPILLTPGDYAVLRRIPAYWFNEDEALSSIGAVVGEPVSVVRRRFTSLIARALVERRRSRSLAAPWEIRKVV